MYPFKRRPSRNATIALFRWSWGFEVAVRARFSSNSVKGALVLCLLGKVPPLHHDGAIVLFGAYSVLHNFHESALHLLCPRIFGVQLALALPRLHLRDNLLQLHNQLAFSCNVVFLLGLEL